MHADIVRLVLSATGAQSIHKTTKVQSLWSGYGQILRLQLRGSKCSSVILKHVKLPDSGHHPRGWNTDISHQRKIRSYQVEAYWYQHYAKLCDKNCEVPLCLAVDSHENETVIVLTDLDAVGFSLRKNQVEIEDIYDCLDWLASFHANFLSNDGKGLWECGTYWHLDTRPDELEALEDDTLRNAAPLIDITLRESRFQTLVHGDAKLANFCFKNNSADNNKMSKVAAVDFQYVGRGCGMKDVAYFIGSCLTEDECEAKETDLLDFYFSVLKRRVTEREIDVNAVELEKEWRGLYAFAWADFHRFIKGWSPGHWKINSYSEKLTSTVIEKLLS